MRLSRRAKRLAKLIGLGLMVAAVSQELAMPPEQRTWHGRVFDLVPYDFRPPTWQRVRDAYWNPDDERLFSDRVFGIGWAINMHRASVLLDRLFRSLLGTRGTVAVRPVYSSVSKPEEGRPSR
jgi:hypothetical protein